MTEQLLPFDASRYIDDEAGERILLQDALDTKDAGYIAAAIGVIAKARGMTAIAKETGMSRESLYRALSEDGNPQLSTVLKVLEAMGLKLTIEPAPKASDAA